MRCGCRCWVWLGELSLWYALLSLIFAGLVLITHKMTTQVFWFTALFAAIFLQDIRIAALIPCSMLMALLLSAGFYRRVFRAHVDIISFWYKNWHWSGSNPILESPIYGEPDFESPSKYYRKGIASWIRRLQFVIGFNPWMPAVLLIVLLCQRRLFRSYVVLVMAICMVITAFFLRHSLWGSLHLH